LFVCFLFCFFQPWLFFFDSFFSSSSFPSPSAMCRWNSECPVKNMEFECKFCAAGFCSTCKHGEFAGVMKASNFCGACKKGSHQVKFGTNAEQQISKPAAAAPKAKPAASKPGSTAAKAESKAKPGKAVAAGDSARWEDAAARAEREIEEERKRLAPAVYVPRDYSVSLYDACKNFRAVPFW
jgi:hypothetical protein